jgi:hypothetical protein
VLHANVEERWQFLETLLGAPRCCPAFDEQRAEIRGVIRVEERFALGQRRLAVLVAIDITVQRTPECGRITAPFGKMSPKDAPMMFPMLNSQA